MPPTRVDDPLPEETFENRREALHCAALVCAEAKVSYGSVNAQTVLRMAEQFETWLNR
jgi:hypothetical protein